MTLEMQRRFVTIIGGGATGVLLAAHLLRDPDQDIRVTLIERDGWFGRGLAYSSHQSDHKVNVPARGMSAFADDPDHFCNWLRSRGFPEGNEPWAFVARGTYGTYLEDVLRSAGEVRPGRLTVVAQEAVEVRETNVGTETILANGTSVIGHQAVLAVGHETQPARGRGIAVRVGSRQDTPLDPYAKVMILGSGLSMVDAWLSLTHADHRGPILVVSRNGLLPKSHEDVPPLGIDAAEVPFGASVRHVLGWFRNRVAQAEAAGDDWRSVVDGMRPHSHRIWQTWPELQRRRFLTHLRPWWNIHRHRLPPDLHQRMLEAVNEGQATLIAGEFLDIALIEGDQVRTRIRRRGAAESETIDVARVYDCGGVSVDVEASSNPVIRDLVATGRGRADPLHIGLDVSPDNHLIDAEGQVSGRLLVAGPLTRGRYFEIEAIPDIRLQCERIARHVLAGPAPARRRAHM